MIKRTLGRLALIGIACLLVLTAFSALAASNTVPPTRLDEFREAIDVNDLKPAACNAINLTAIYRCPSGGGTCNATNANELVLGSPYADTINGRQGNDCVMGGGGNDTLHGNNGNDVCIGGPGNDSFNNTCEVQIQ